MRKVCILNGARLFSTRMPDKLLQEVAGVRLIDSGLQRIKATSQKTGCQAFLALCPEEKPLLEAAAKYHVDVLELSKEASMAEDWAGAFAGLGEKLASLGFDWVADSNFLCLPFLTVATCVKIVNHVQESDDLFYVSRKKRGVVADATGKIVIGVGETCNMKLNPIYHEPAHLAYGLPVSLLAKEAETAAVQVPWSIEMPWWEWTDIDTMEHIHLANAIAKSAPWNFNPELIK